MEVGNESADENFLDFLKNNNLLNDEELDPDKFLNSNLSEDILDTPVYDGSFNAKDIHTFSFENSFSILSLNIRSLYKNFDEFRMFLDTSKASFSVICLQETWAKNDNPQNLQAIYHLPGYECYHVPRGYDKRGGGVCIYVEKGMHVIEKPEISVSNEDIEAQLVEIVQHKSKKIISGNVYRPPHGKMKPFNETIQKFVSFSKQKPFFLSGDLNLNLFSFDVDPKVKNFLNKMRQSSILPTITKATRFNKNKSTCIDNIYSNICLTNSVNSGIIHAKISDHFPIFVNIQGMTDVNITGCKKSTISTRRFTSENVVRFNNEIRSMSWSTVISSNDTNVSYDNFSDLITNVYNKCFPVELKVVKEKCMLNKWMTKGLLKASKRKQVLYKKFMNKKTIKSENEYKKYSRTFNKLKEKAKQNYYSEKILANENNLKKLWTTMKGIISKNQIKNTYPSVLNVEGKNVYAKKDIAQEFNKFFTTVGLNLSSKIKPTKTDASLLVNEVSKRFKVNLVDEAELNLHFSNLNVNKAPGDGYNVRVIKNAFDAFKTPLLHICNLSLKNGEFPEKMKLAKVLPLFKSGNKCDVGNYRPISLLPLFSKILERIMHSRLYHYFESNKLFYHKQFGFRKKFSVDYGLMEAVDSISQSMSKKELTLGVFIDLSKAFDTVDHKILLSKLKKYGIVGEELLWFDSYLKNRKQFVKVDESESNILDISCGVPQGSILGPLLFLIYVNDMHLSVPKLNVVMFADDTNLFISGKDHKNLFNIMNNQLELIDDWFAANKLSLNVQKTKYTLFCSSLVEDNLPLKLPTLLFGTKEISRSRYTKFLGVLIDENLNWKKQIKAIESKISSQIGIINRGRKVLNNKAMKMLYFAFVNPYLTYGNIVWGSVGKTKLNKLANLQKRAVRLITQAPRRSHSRPLMISLNILNIFEINLINHFKLMYKVFKKSIPTFLQEKFIKNNHRYPTRFSADTYKLDDYNINIYNKFNYSFRSPYIWNYFVTVHPDILIKSNPVVLVKKILLKEKQIELW